MWKEGNKIVGVGPELVKLIFKKRGIIVNSKYVGNWKRVQNSAKQGSIDIIVPAYKTKEREAFLEYPSQPFSMNQAVIWVWKDKSFPFQNWGDLIGKRGAGVIGESYGQAFDTFIEEKLTFYRVSTINQVYEMMRASRVDYMPFGLYPGYIQALRFGYDKKIEPLPYPFLSEGLFIAIAKTSKFSHLTQLLDQEIIKMKKNNFIQKLIKKTYRLLCKKYQKINTIS